MANPKANNTEKPEAEPVSQIADTHVPSSKLREEDLLNEFGATGTRLVEGFLESDYLSTLAGTQGLDTYDKMRKSDAQVFATLLVIELPIRSTQWYIDPAQNEDGEIDDQSQEIADFVKQALFEKMEQTWDDFLREALTMLPLGFSVHEKVYYVEGGKVWVKKLGSRKQRTVYKWQQEDRSAGITQFLPQVKAAGDNAGRNMISIPASKLLIFSFRREGDNYAGVSVLRSAYKNWYIKDKLYKFDAVKHERQSIGIPMMWMPKGATDEDKAEAKKIVKNIKANEQTGIVFPGPKEDGWDFAFADMHAGSTSNLWESIEHHNREISKNVLAQFLELGATKSGSRAVSADHSELFLLGLQAIAQQVADTINRFLIKELVDLNFDGVERYPELKFKRIEKIDFDKLGTFLGSLATGGWVRPDEGIEEQLRDMLDFPSIPDDMPTRQEQKEQDMQQEQDMAAQQAKLMGKMPPGKAPPGKPAVKATDPPGEYSMFSALANNRAIIRLQNEAATPEELAKLKKKGFRFNDAESWAWRPLTFAERKVNLSALRKSIDSFESKLKETMDEITARQKADLLAQVKKAVEADDIAAVGQIRTRFTGELAQALTDVQKEMFEVGKKSAANEMSVPAPATKNEVRGAMRVQNDAFVAKIAADMENAAKTAVTQVAGKNGGRITNTNAADALEAASGAIDGALDDVATAQTLAVTGALNLGRATIFDRYPEKVYAIQYSAILDSKTCDTCFSLDGRVMRPTVALADFNPPIHWKCRCILVEILHDEVFKPEIEEVPGGIPKVRDIAQYEDMKAPVVKPNSPAIRQIKAEIADRQQKLDQYRAAGTYPNRQATHEQRIKDLQDSLENAFGELCLLLLEDAQSDE